MAGIFLLNTLIAMMADTYQRYEVNKLRTYQLSFAKMVIYWGELAAPAPFSALSLPYELLLMAARRLSDMHPTNAFKRSRVMAFHNDGSGQSADAAPPERLGARGTTPTWKAPKGRERMTMRNSVKTLIDSDVKKLVSGDELHGQDLEPCSLPEWVAANPLAAYLHTIANTVSEETESAAERALRCAQRCLDGPALYRATSFVLGCPLLRASWEAARHGPHSDQACAQSVILSTSPPRLHEQMRSEMSRLVEAVEALRSEVRATSKAAGGTADSIVTGVSWTVEPKHEGDGESK